MLDWRVAGKRSDHERAKAPRAQMEPRKAERVTARCGPRVDEESNRKAAMTRRRDLRSALPDVSIRYFDRWIDEPTSGVVDRPRSQTRRLRRFEACGPPGYNGYARAPLYAGRLDRVCRSDEADAAAERGVGSLWQCRLPAAALPWSRRS